MYNKKNYRAGSRNNNEPRLVGDIIAEMLSSDPRLAKVLRLSHVLPKEATAAKGQTTVKVVKGWYPNTDLCVDIKTFLRDDRTTKIGKDYTGMLQRDSDDHYLFVETAQPASAACKRNPRLFDGKYISVTYRLQDGHVRFNFKEVNMNDGFNAESFAIGVMNEILQAIKDLVGEVEA